MLWPTSTGFSILRLSISVARSFDSESSVAPATGVRPSNPGSVSR